MGRYICIMVSNYSSNMTTIVGETHRQTTPDLEMSLNYLARYQNYTVQVAALTRKGEGVKSVPIYCRTKEDGKYIPAIIRY